MGIASWRSHEHVVKSRSVSNFCCGTRTGPATRLVCIFVVCLRLWHMAWTCSSAYLFFCFAYKAWTFSFFFDTLTVDRLSRHILVLLFLIL